MVMIYLMVKIISNVMDVMCSLQVGYFLFITKMDLLKKCQV